MRSQASAICFLSVSIVWRSPTLSKRVIRKSFKKSGMCTFAKHSELHYIMFYIAIPEHRPFWKKSHNCLALWVANTHGLNGFEIVLKRAWYVLHSSLDVHVWTINESYKEEIDDVWSHPLHRVCCGQYQAPSAVPGWLGDGQYCLHTQRPLALSHQRWLEDSCCWLQGLRTKVTSC